MDLWMETAADENVTVRKEHKHYDPLLARLKYPKTDGFSLWRWEIMVTRPAKLTISITHPYVLRVIYIELRRGFYACQLTTYEKTEHISKHSLQDLFNRLESALARYALVSSYFIDRLQMEPLKELKFPCMQGPFKNAWIIVVRMPMTITIGNFSKTSLNFSIQRVRGSDYYFAVKGQIEQKTQIVTLESRDCTSDEFQEIGFQFKDQKSIAQYIQTILDTYGMLEPITREASIEDNNVVMYDMTNQLQKIKTWNDVVLSTIQFPPMNEKNIHQWVISDRVFDEIYKFDGAPEQYKFLSVTMKSPYHKNIIFIASAGDDQYYVAYKDFEQHQFTETRRSGADALRQCIRATLQTYAITGPSVVYTGDEAKLWTCINRLSDIIGAFIQMPPPASS